MNAKRGVEEVLRIQAWAQTDVGRQRHHNEDSFLIDRELGLFGVADGMGGHAAGEVASSMALQELKKAVAQRIDEFRKLADNPERNYRKLKELFNGAIQQAAKAVHNFSRKRPSSRGMGTTLSVLFILDKKGLIAHVGDSRIFLYRNGQITRLTDDHSLVQEQLKLGLITEEEAERSPYKNVITRAVGANESVEADIQITDLFPGDRLLICSDGLHGYLEDRELLAFLGRDYDLQRVPGELIDLANERGGKDNITAVLVAIDALEATLPEISSPASESELPSASPRDKLRKTGVTLRTEILQQLPLFTHFSYEELLQIMNITFIKKYDKNELIFKEGKKGELLYIVFKGEVALQSQGQKIFTCGEGEVFGDWTFVEPQPREFTAIAKAEDTQLLTIQRKKLMAILRQNPNLAVKLFWGLMKGMVGKSRQLLRMYLEESKKTSV